ncbi:MAG TPA: AsmA-like C-terminal region-containing protein [Opitutales bacterium]|nr:AsmA-like C-terminal region-containing protein [Opitutales bacterium]
MSSRQRSRVASFIELFLDGFLLLCFIIQAFLLFCVLAYGQLPLPTNWLSKTINDKLPAGISITADNYFLTLGGTVRVENLAVSLEGIRQPVFDADYADLEFSLRGFENGDLPLGEYIVSNARLWLPAVYSPSGKHSVILNDIALRLIPVKSGFEIDSFAARHEDIRLRGSVKWKGGPDSQPPEDLRRKMDLFYKQVAKVLKEKPRIEGFSQPTISFEVSSENGHPLNIRSRISSRSYDQAQLRARNLTLDASLSLSDQTLLSESPVLLQADAVESPVYKTRATRLKAKVDRDGWEALLKRQWPDMEVVAETLEVEGIRLDSPRLSLGLEAFPQIAFEGYTSGLEGAVRFAGSIHADSRRGNLQAAGSIDLLEIAPEELSGRLPAIKVKRAPYYNLSVDWGEGFSIANADLRARVDELEVEGLSFDHIRLRSSYSGGKYSIDQLYLRRNWQWLNLGFDLDGSTGDYALTLKGFAKPYDYNAILPDWWGRIFKDFDFEKVGDGLGDFVIRGNTNRKAADFYFGHVTARNVAYKGVWVEKGELFVRGRGPYAEIYRLDAQNGNGFARGDIRFASRLDEVRGPVSLRLDLETKLALGDAKKLFDENISEILSDFETDGLPETRLKGAIFNSAYPEFAGLSYIDIKAACPFPLTFKDIPLENLSFDLYGREEMTYLRNMALGYAGGRADASADILSGGDEPVQTRFILSLKGANQNEAISRIADFRISDESLSKEALAKGRLDFDLHARGPVEKPLHMEGFGSFRIQNEELYAIQLFGPLSRLVQNTRFGFTSFALDEMEASFALDDGIVDFRKLVVNGPRTRLEAPGKLDLDDLSLDMRVSVYLFGNAGNPESNIRKIGEFITRPIPNILEFELTGTPSDQTWRSLYDPRKFIPIF